MQAGRARLLAYSAVFSSLVFAATLVSIYFPATGGYFNLGESMVYTAALLGGPLVGAVAGGLGSALADVYLGYAQYAPGTLVIKSAEGAIVGALYLALSRLGRERLRVIGVVGGILAALGLLRAGLYVYGILYGEPVELYLGANASISFTIPAPVWVGLSLAVGAGIVYASYRLDPKTAAAVVSMLAGGAVMVTGYFLYEAVFLGLGLTAAAEIPVNIGQALVGASIALSITSAVRSAEG